MTINCIKNVDPILPDDVLFTLVKNRETFSLDKLCQLFPLIDSADVKLSYQTALSNRTLLDRVMSEKANIIKFTERKVETPETVVKTSNIPVQKKFPDNYVTSLTEPIVTIHVLDDSNDQKADFQCGRELLVKEMKYFGDYLPIEESALSEIDISVHCDIAIFALLMQWVKSRAQRKFNYLNYRGLINGHPFDRCFSKFQYEISKISCFK